MKIHLLAGTAVLALPAFAQSAQTTAAGSDNSTNQLQQIVVTATRSAEKLNQVPASVSVVSARQIADTPAQGLDDILQLVPGMSLNEIGPDVGHPTAYNEAMRGLPTNETRMLVLMDGVPVNDPFFGYIQWNRVPLDDISKVEIVRGGGSPLWGSDAMGGVVNVITTPPAGNHYMLDAAGGTLGTYQTNALASVNIGAKLKLTANIAVNGTNGYQTTPRSWTSYGSTTLRSPLYVPTSFNSQNAGARLDYNPDGDTTAWLNMNWFNDHQVLSTAIGDNAQNTFSYSAGAQQNIWNGSLTETLFHNDSGFTTDNPHLLTPTTQYNSNIHATPVNDTGTSLTWSQKFSGILRSYMLGADAHYIGGGDHSQYYLTNGQLAVPTIDAGGRQFFLAGFAQVLLRPIDNLDVTASMRYQYYENFDGLDTFPPTIGKIPSSSSTSFDPRVNLRYRVTDNFALRGAFYRSFRAPTLDELYRTYADTTAGIYEGNPYLRPETLEGGEIGFDYTRSWLRMQTTLYTANITNLITQTNLTPAQSPSTLGVECGYDSQTYTYLTCTRNVNAASALTRGVEAELDFDLGHGVSGVLAYTYADSHYISDPVDPGADGERLEGVPRYNISGQIAYAAPQGWRVAADARYVTNSWGDPFPADGLIVNQHFVVDLSGSYPITRSLTAYMKVQNLFNRTYIANNGGGVPILGTPFEMLGGFKLVFK